MKKRTRRLISVAMAMIMGCMCFAGCSSKTPATDNSTTQSQGSGSENGNTPAKQKKLHIGYVTNSLAADSNSRAYKAFESIAKEKGWKVTLTDGTGDIVKMNDGIMNCVSLGVDAIVIACAEVKPLVGAYDAAKAANIPVFSIDTGLDDNGAILANVTSNCYTMGAEVATQIVNRLNGKGNVVIMQMPTIRPHRNRIEAAKAVFNSVDCDITVLEEEALTAQNWEKNSYDTMNTWLIKYGKKIDAVLVSADPIAWGTTRAIMDSGYTKDDVFLMTIDGTEAGYDYIRDGAPFVGTCAQNFSAWAIKTAELIEKILVYGEDPGKVIPASRILYVDYKWIDESNCPEKGKTSDVEIFGK